MPNNNMNHSSRTYVLVHGAWHGGWVWRTVSDHLIAEGHRVTAPTLTGLGERAHLAMDDVDLETHVNDIVQHVNMENLDEIVLVGWSYGGMVITGVISKIPDRISSVVYLDAFIPENGKSLVDYTAYQMDLIKSLLADGKKLLELPKNAYQDRWRINDPEIIDNAAPRLTPQHIKTFTDPVEAPLGLPEHINYTYIKLSGEQEIPFMQFYKKALTDPLFSTEKFEDGHMIMLTNPEKLVNSLLELK